jgi:hypothetical protein
MTDDSHPVESPDLAPRRFRSFVARPAEALPAAGSPPLAGSDDDIPLLTEIVAPDNAAPPLNAIDPAALRAAIEDSMKRWIDEALLPELPQLLEKLENGTRQKL